MSSCRPLLGMPIAASLEDAGSETARVGTMASSSSR